MTMPRDPFNVGITVNVLKVLGALPKDGAWHTIAEVAKAGGVGRDPAKGCLRNFAANGVLEESHAVSPIRYRWRARVGKPQQALLEKIDQARKIYG